LGQHFLRDRGVAAAIAAAVPASSGRVLEIGPGRGALTVHLLERFSRVRVVELDEALAARMEGQAATTPGLEVWRADAVTVDLDELTGGEPWPVAANLPYSVATPIVRRLLRRPDLFPRLVVMVQREVAERMAAPPGGRARGLLTLEVELAARATVLFTVPPAAFSPPPRVDSSVVQLECHARRLDGALAERVLSLAAAAFTHRRKKLSTSLRGGADPAALERALASARIADGSRPEHLELGQWVSLARSLATGAAA